ncbi:substrate-binding periplasmic protein [Moraxella oblonga]|uniref:substrate-binding periplasmic protein n=1 Tax=Moraxella oblonga TaxID=200413 RepID=UPI00082B31F6|nr:transporter substrate-binding domain-containing protein [Moraxella oblonga]
MKSILKIITWLGVMTLTLGMIGCDNNKEPVQSTPAKKLPIIRVVTDGESPPMSFVDEHGDLQGIDIDIIRAIGEQQGFDVEISRELFDNMFKGLSSGRHHVAIGSLSLTPERANKYNPTETYLHNPAIVLHNQSSKLNELSQIKPLRVATTKGTMYTDIAENLQPAKHYVTNTNFQNYQGLLLDRFDAILGDKYILEYMLARHPHKPLHSFEYQIGDGSSANMVFYVGKNNQELLDKLNQGIRQLKASGKIDDIVQNYLSKAH